MKIFHHLPGFVYATSLNYFVSDINEFCKNIEEIVIDTSINDRDTKYVNFNLTKAHKIKRVHLNFKFYDEDGNTN